MTLAIAHRENARVGLDLVRERPSRFSPDEVVKEFAETLRRYNIRSIRGDRYGGEWPRERFRAHGIAYDVAELAKSDLYRELAPLLNSKQVELLDYPRLISQLLRLERRVTRGGRESIDYAPNGHDDVVNAVAGVPVGAPAFPARRDFVLAGGNRVAGLFGVEPQVARRGLII